MKNTTRFFPALPQSFVQRFSSASRLSMPSLPKRVTIQEVGARDGLQNERMVVPTENKFEFLEMLGKAHPEGIIEGGSFVNPKFIPQFGDSPELIRNFPEPLLARTSWLVLNERGLDAALQGGAKRISVVDSPSNSFAKGNMGTDVISLFNRNRELIEKAGKEKVPVDVYISTSFHCPFEGYIHPIYPILLIKDYLGMSNVGRVTISDTTGRAMPQHVRELLMRFTPLEMGRLALHTHDTFGMALANVLAAVEMGVVNIDASVLGLGGCPIAKGTGNIATELLVTSLERMGVETGVDLHALIQAGKYISGVLGKAPKSPVYEVLKDKSPEEIEQFLVEERTAYRQLAKRQEPQIAL
jgi:isopropylmalate/homocitrate/citramalate synthase